MGRVGDAFDHLALATSSEDAEGDVFAELAYALAVTGDRSRALDLLQRADSLDRMGLLDMEGRHQSIRTRALLAMARDPRHSLQMLDAVPTVTPFDFGFNVLASVLRTVALLLVGEEFTRAELLQPRFPSAWRGVTDEVWRGSALYEALASGDATDIQGAIVRAAACGNLALLEVADAIGPSLHRLVPVPAELHESFERWPQRWRPVLRRQLEFGSTAKCARRSRPSGQLRRHRDIGRLRAFEKTYRRGRKDGLGRSLARRLSPRLQVHDLGRG